jgi:hypothetical protein
VIKERSRDGVWVVEWQVDRGQNKWIVWNAASSVGDAVVKCEMDYEGIVMECIEEHS